MAEYRLYSLGGDGSLSLAEEIVANSDEEAMTRARELKRYARKCEVWQGHRLVAELHEQDLAG